MAIIILAVMGSLAFLWITVAIAQGRFGAGGVALFCLLAGFFSVGVLPLFLSSSHRSGSSQSLLTLFTALVCAGFGAKPKAMIEKFRGRDRGQLRRGDYDFVFRLSQLRFVARAFPDRING